MTLALTLATLLATVSPMQEVDPAPGGDEAPREAIRVLEIVQTSNGLPGQQGQVRSTQKLYVAENMLRLSDLETGVVYLFRIDDGKSHIWEISPDLKWFQKADKLAEIQRDRDLFEHQILDGEADDEVLARAYLKRGLKRDVTIESFDSDSTILDYKVRRYVIKENGRIIVDALLTEEIVAPGPFFEFYRNVGAFSAEVLDKLKELKGVPLKASITVVTAAMNYKIESEVKKVAPALYLPALFDLPRGAQPAKETGLISHCPVCGASVDTQGAAGGHTKDRSGKRYYFDRTACKKTWRKMNLPKKETPKLPEPAKPAKDKQRP